MAYLCGVDVEHIRQRYGVSDATIRGNIVGKRSLEWSDPLVAFYRKTPPGRRERNSAHLYLVFQGRQVPRAELVDVAMDAPVYHAVDETMYRPRTESVVQALSLGRFLQPSDGFERLLLDVFGMRKRDPITMVTPVLVDRLGEAYGDHPNRFSLEDVFNQLYEALLEKIKHGDLGMTAGKVRQFEEVLKTLSPRQEEVLSLRYGLYGEEQTRNEIAKREGVTPLRIRQIEVKALRMLQRPPRSGRLKILLGLVTDADIEACAAREREVEEKAEWKRKLYSEIRQEVLGEVSPDFMPLADLGLSVRIRNCLEIAGITTLNQLVTQWTEQELLKIRYLGRRSLQKLQQIVEERGLPPLRKS